MLYLVTYQCPRCQASLETGVGAVPEWLRCPGCGKAVLPPENERLYRPSPSVGGYLDDPLNDGPKVVMGVPFTPGQSLPVTPRSMAPLPKPAGSTASNVRILFGLGFFLTTCIFLFSLLDRSGLRSTASGVAALIFLLLLCLPSRRPPLESFTPE